MRIETTKDVSIYEKLNQHCFKGKDKQSYLQKIMECNFSLMHELLCQMI